MSLALASRARLGWNALLRRQKRSRIGDAGLGVLGRRVARAERPLTVPLFAALLLLVIWSATLHFIDIERISAQRAVTASLAELVDTYEAQVARNLAGIQQTLKTLRYAVKLNGTAGALAALRQEDLLPSGLIFVVGIADAQGRLVASNPQAGAASIATQAFFVRHKEVASDTSLVSISSTPGERGAHVLHFTQRLNDGAGHFIGVAMVDVDPAYFTIGYERARLGEQGMLALYGEHGDILALRVGEHLAAGIKAALPPAARGVALASSWDGVRRYSAVRSLYRPRLHVVVGLAEAEQMAGFAARRSASLWQAGAISALLLAAAGLHALWSRQGARTRRSIRMAQETYAAASQANPDAFFVLHSVCDDAGVIVDFQISEANRQAEYITGLSRQELQRQRLSAWMPDSMSNGVFAKLVHATTSGGVHESEFENTIAHIKGDWLHEQLVGVEGGVVAIVRDVSERKYAEAKILHLAQHDTLTGMPNRSLLNLRLAQAIRHADRRHGAVLVAFLDLDNFKLVNDGLGHGAGDALLLQIAARMRECLRRQDTLGRFGGDEFVLVIPAQQSRLDACMALLDRINAVVRTAVDIKGQVVQVSCSIGAAIYPRDGAEADALLVRADAAMYSAKAAGKNQVRFYSEDMDSRAED